MGGRAIPTVKIHDIHDPNAPGDFVIINQADYDAKLHKLFDDKKKSEPKPPTGTGAPGGAGEAGNNQSGAGSDAK